MTRVVSGRSSRTKVCLDALSSELSGTASQGERVQIFRKHAGLSQEQFAGEIYGRKGSEKTVSTRTINNWEQGHKSPRIASRGNYRRALTRWMIDQGWGHEKTVSPIAFLVFPDNPLANDEQSKAATEHPKRLVKNRARKAWPGWPLESMEQFFRRTYVALAETFSLEELKQASTSATIRCLRNAREHELADRWKSLLSMDCHNNQEAWAKLWVSHEAAAALQEHFQSMTAPELQAARASAWDQRGAAKPGHPDIEWLNARLRFLRGGSAAALTAE